MAPPDQTVRISRLERVLWFLFILLFPFYLWPSGTPQLADIFFVLLLGVVAVRVGTAGGYRVDEVFVWPLVALTAFVLYAWLVTCAWNLIIGDARLLMAPLFYLYDLLVFAVVALLFQNGGVGFLRLTLHAVAVSLLVQLLLAPFTVDLTGFRQTLFFNNPNQLGYFALLCVALFAIAARKLSLGAWYLFGVTIGALVLAGLSLSKSAFLGIAVLLVLQVFRRPAVGIAVALLILGVAYVHLELPFTANIESRIGSVGQDLDDSLAGRGYDRLVNHPGFLFLGAAEGAFERFDSVLMGEMHSSFGTVVFAYGLVGLGLFLFFLAAVVVRGDHRSAVFLVPVFLHGLTHQGLRFRLFWIVLAFFCCLGSVDGPTERGREAEAA